MWTYGEGAPWGFYQSLGGYIVFNRKTGDTRPVVAQRWEAERDAVRLNEEAGVRPVIPD